MARTPGSKKLILEFFLQNIGKVLTSKDIQKASGGASEWARRVREHRNEDGYQILSHKDRASLKPDQYLMETAVRLPAFSRAISKETRAQILERNGYTCQMCGVAAGDPDPLGGNRTVRLTMGHIIDKSKGGDDSPQICEQFARTATKACKTRRRQNRIDFTFLARSGEQRARIRKLFWNGCFRNSI